MATTLLVESCENQLGRWPNPTVQTVIYHLSLRLLMHPCETGGGN